MPDPSIAAKDAEAIAGAEGVLQALARSPAGRAMLEKSGKTIEEIATEVAKRGPAALKEALETPAGRGVTTAMKEVWDKLPAGVRGAVVASGAYVGSHIIDTVAEKLQEYEKNALDAILPEAKPKAITISQSDGPERPMAPGGLTGRVVGDDGRNVEFEVGRDTFAIHNLPPDRVAALASHGSDLQHVAVDKEGLLQVSDLGRGGPQTPVQSQQQSTAQGVHPAAASHGGR